jgi:class 3 adenylate cyclase
VLQDYYRCVGESIDRFEGTLEHFADDGLLIIFNDPIPCEDLDMLIRPPICASPERARRL